MTVQPTRDQLRALADAATPHPPFESEGAWQTDGYAEYIVVDSEQDCDGEYGHVAEAANERLGAFIAAADPNTVRALLDQLDQAEARIAAWEAQYAQDIADANRDTDEAEERARHAGAEMFKYIARTQLSRLDLDHWRDQAQAMEARIKAVRDVLDKAILRDGTEERELARRIRRALDG